MFKRKQKEKAEAARSITFGGALVASLFSLLLGVAIGFINLATTPVTEVRDLPPPDERKDRTVYYVVGQDRGGSAYRTKLTVLLQEQPGTLKFNEGDLNAWARDTFKFGTNTEQSTGLIQIKPAAPRFSIRDSKLTISMPMEVDAFGQNRRVLVQAQGTFSDESGTWVFLPEDTHMGSASVPDGLLANALRDSLLGIFKSTEEYTTLNEAWHKLSQVTLTGDELILVRR